MSPIVRFILEEAPRQHRPYKTICERAGFDKDTIYRWKGTKGKMAGSNPRLDAVEGILSELGFELKIVERFK